MIQSGMQSLEVITVQLLQFQEPAEYKFQDPEFDRMPFDHQKYLLAQTGKLVESWHLDSVVNYMNHLQVIHIWSWYLMGVIHCSQVPTKELQNTQEVGLSQGLMN